MRYIPREMILPSRHVLKSGSVMSDHSEDEVG